MTLMTIKTNSHSIKIDTLRQMGIVLSNTIGDLFYPTNEITITFPRSLSRSTRNELSSVFMALSTLIDAAGMLEAGAPYRKNVE